MIPRVTAPAPTNRRSTARVAAPARSRRAGLFILLLAVIWSLGLPLSFDLAAVALPAIAAIRARPAHLLALLIALVAAVGLGEIAIRLLARRLPGQALRCNDFDAFVRNVRYEPNARAVFADTHGDLVGMDPLAAPLIQEPRTIRLQVDALGYRNDMDYAGQHWILAGDSFIVGCGVDQSDLLANVLRRDHAIDAYSIAFPNDPEHYFLRIANFLRDHPAAANVRALVFIFEGNDFQGTPRPLSEPSAYDSAKGRFIGWTRPALLLPSALFSASRQLERRLRSDRGQLVEIHAVGGRPMGFFGNYIDCATSPTLAFREPFTSDGPVRDHVAAVYFIPDKYRVYHDLLDHPDGRMLPEPAPGLITTRARFEPHGIPVVDLTPALRAAARRLLPEGRTVFWRDDTHWNGEGIRAAAEVVAQWIAGQSPAPRTQPTPSSPPIHSPPDTSPPAASLPTNSPPVAPRQDPS